MDTDKQFNIQIGSQSYRLITSEYFGTANPRYMVIRSELRGEKFATLFVLGIDLMLMSVKYNGIPKEEVTKRLYSAATDSITEYLNTNELVEGTTYYGEYLENESFEIGQEKPDWEDCNWGQKIDF